MLGITAPQEIIDHSKEKDKSESLTKKIFWGII